MTEAQDKGYRFESKQSPDSGNNRYKILRRRLECIHCSKVYLIRDIDSFLDQRWTLWHLVLSKLRILYTKRQIIASLAIANARDYH